MLKVIKVIKVAKVQATDQTICDDWIYVFWQVAMSIFVGIFNIFGYFVAKRVKEQGEAATAYEAEFRNTQQKNALKNLKMIINVFTFVQAYCLLYELILFFTNGGCEYPTKSLAAGFIIWLVTKTITYFIWVYPIIYIFWPHTLTRLLKKTFCPCRESRARSASARRFAFSARRFFCE